MVCCPQEQTLCMQFIEELERDGCLELGVDKEGGY